MAYTVLARRYRSSTFDEVVGQDHVAKTLKRAIESDRIAHAYLFNGTRGVGKTSMARILAKALNCEKSSGPTTEPCLKCASCTAIARGDDIDVIEIDAASNTGVDNVRGIIENAQYRPARSRFKVYIIDEVHMLSKSAFNALLKTLEEPPEHVKFILATTEPEKVLPTIHSRCQRYDFRNIPAREIQGHLRNVCKEEGIKADEDALLLVAKTGAGSMRDSLSLLDRLLSIGEKKLTVETIEQLLGLPRSQVIFDLADAIGRGDVKNTLVISNKAVSEGLSPDTLIVSLTDHFRNLLVLKTCGADSDLVEAVTVSIKDLEKQAGSFDPVALSQSITILEDLRRQLKQSQAGRALLDATLVRLALAEQFSSITDLLSRLEGGAPPAPAQKKKPEPVLTASTPVQAQYASTTIPSPGTPGTGQGEGSAPPAPPTEALTPLPPDEAIASPHAAPTSAPPVSVENFDLDDNDALPAVGKVWDTGPKMSLSALLKQDAQKRNVATPPPPAPTPAPAPASNVEPVDPENFPAIWRRLLALLEQQGPGLLSLLQAGHFAGIEEGQAIIRYAPEQETFTKMLNKNGKREIVSDALSQVLGKPMGVRFVLSDGATPANGANGASTRPGAPPAGSDPTTAPTPPQQPSGRLTPEQVAEFEKDPLIGTIMGEFNAVIVKLSDD